LPAPELWTAVIVVTLLVLAAIAASGTAGATTVPPASGPAWSCSVSGYLFHTTADGKHQIMRIDLASGATAQVARTAAILNAAGYNTLDNYVYAWSGGQLVRVADDGAVTRLGDPTHSGGSFAIGDLDDAGHLFLTLQATTAPWYEIDLAPGSVRYGTVIASGTRTTPAGLASGADWSWVSGALYMLALPSRGPKTPHLVRFTPSTSDSVDLGTLPFTVPGKFTGPMLNVFGATYADHAGNLYAQYNGGGQIYRVPVTDLSAAHLLTVGPATSYNDGARCLRAANPLGVQAGGTSHTILILVLVMLALLLVMLLFLLARRRRRRDRQRV
jgi:hypothetical protein